MSVASVELWDNGAEPVKAWTGAMHSLIVPHVRNKFKNQTVNIRLTYEVAYCITPKTRHACWLWLRVGVLFWKCVEEVWFYDRDLDFGGSSAVKDLRAHSAVRRWSVWTIHAATFSPEFSFGGKYINSWINEIKCVFLGRSRWWTSSNEVSWSWDSNMKVLLLFMFFIWTCAPTVSLQILRSTVGINKC